MITIPDQALFNEHFLNALPSKIKRELVLHDQISIDFTSKDQLWTAVLRVDHAFDSLRAISAYCLSDSTNLSSNSNKFQPKNKANNYNRQDNTTQQPQTHRLMRQVLNRTNSSVQNRTNYSNTKSFTPHHAKHEPSKQKGNTNSTFRTSKFTPCSKQPSTDKAGNPICFKCGKIGFAQECLKHPYKPRVFTLGIAESLEIMEEIPDEQVESDASDQENVLETEEDQYIEDPYNGENLPEMLTLGDDVQEDMHSSRINMMTFVNESQDPKYTQLVSIKQTDKSTILNTASKPTSESVLCKVMKRTPPILDSKLRISQQAGTYPTNQSTDIHCTLTAEVCIGDVDAFVLFDSGAETDALSPDFVRACNLPLLELLNPMVLQM